jgi:hypothetical protein
VCFRLGRTDEASCSEAESVAGEGAYPTAERAPTPKGKEGRWFTKALLVDRQDGEDACCDLSPATVCPGWLSCFTL